MLAGQESVSVIARLHDINANLLFKWKRLYLAGSENTDQPTNLLPVQITELPRDPVPDPMTPQIANLFKKYQLKPVNVRCGEVLKKGYKIDRIKTILRRYVPDENPATHEQKRHKSPEDFVRRPVSVDLGVTPSQMGCDTGLSGFDGVTSYGSVTPGNCRKPAPHNDCYLVTPVNGVNRLRARKQHNLSETDKEAVLDWLRLKGETDPDNISYTLERCAANPATLAWILSGGKSPTTNGESKDLSSSEQEVTLLQRIADRGVNARLENGKPIYESGQEMSAAQMTWIEENEQQIIDALKTRDAG